MFPLKKKLGTRVRYCKTRFRPSAKLRNAAKPGLSASLRALRRGRKKDRRGKEGQVADLLPRKTNMSPEIQWLEDAFPIEVVP